jgi:glutathione S-transferase
VDDGQVVQDSTEIIHYLDRKYPEKPLTPAPENLKKEATQLEEYFDQEVGVHLRRYFYFYVLEDRRLAASLLLRGASAYGRPLYFFIYPVLKRLMKKAMNIYPAPAQESEKRLHEALEKLDRRVQKGRFLVGDRFSRADLTAASLLAPLCTPPEHDFTWPPVESMPGPLVSFRRDYEKESFFQWVLEIYRDYRRNKPSL